jgi:small nuclear ribonucleoprotein D3
VYRGHLVESEDNMNMQLSNVTLTARDGRTSNLEQCFIRGSKIRFMVLPDMLKNAPMFKRVDPKLKGQGGRGGPMPMGRGGGGFRG